jgi:hypothetical protein
VISGNRSGDDGGGLRVIGTAAVADSRFEGNVAVADGGGFRADTAVVTDTTFDGNNAHSGGGLAVANSVTLTRCTFVGNISTETGRGGGLFSEASATLTNCAVNGNFAVGGGGGIATFGTANLTNCTINGNSTGGNGGGINSASLTLTNSTVSNNIAGLFGGGAIADTANLTNCTLTGNIAASDGGGILATTAALLNCTVVENRAQNGGGLFHLPGGTFSLRNSIIALNLVGFGFDGPDASGEFASGGHNLVGEDSGAVGFTDGFNDDIVGTNADPIDPKLGPLAANGGRTKTMALLPGSLAIDAGVNAGAPDTDQRGFARKKDGNGDSLAIVDIGAFER